MPQLNPNPWFLIMLMSWTTLSFILQPKLLSFITLNNPTDKTPTTMKAHSWNWPWT